MGFGDCRVCIRWVTTVPEYHMTQFELDFTSMCTSWKLISRVKDNHDLTRFEVVNFLEENNVCQKNWGNRKKNYDRFLYRSLVSMPFEQIWDMKFITTTIKCGCKKIWRRQRSSVVLRSRKLFRSLRFDACSGRRTANTVTTCPRYFGKSFLPNHLYYSLSRLFKTDGGWQSR